MNPEKNKKMVEILNEDLERADELFKMTPEEAAQRFTELGCNISSEEVAKFGEALKKEFLAFQTSPNELDESALENVAGGAFADFCYGLSAGCIAIGVAAVLIPW